MCQSVSASLRPLSFRRAVKASGSQVQDRLQHGTPLWAPWMTVVTSPSGSYTESNLLDYMDKVLPPLTPDRGWRILLGDWFTPHQKDSVRLLAWSRGSVLVLHGGGATPVCQPNDTDLHAHLRRHYVELEQQWMMAEQSLDPHKCPVPKKVDCMEWMARYWSKPALHRRGGGGFKSFGLSVDLSGQEDHLIVREAAVFWKALDMPRWRREVLHDVEVETRAGRLRWTLDDVASAILDFPPVPARSANTPHMPAQWALLAIPMRKPGTTASVHIIGAPRGTRAPTRAAGSCGR